jgi:hypothetical protein
MPIEATPDLAHPVSLVHFEKTKIHAGPIRTGVASAKESGAKVRSR